MRRPALSVEERWSQYVRVGDGCWPWVGATDPKGYGRFGINGSVLFAHRVGYEFFVGPIPDGYLLRHRCDNPPCVRPDHLLPGTDQDNADDMRRRGRANYGKRLTMADAQAIRAAARAGAPSLAELARMFGVSKSTVSVILLNQTWRDGSPPIHVDGTGSRHPRSKLSREDVLEIQRLRGGGWLFKDIATRFGVSKPSARKAALGMSYRSEIGR